MYYEPEQLKGYLVRSLKRLSEDDCIEAIRVLSQRLLDLRNPDYYLTIPAEELPLSAKAANALLFNQLLNVREVIQYGYGRLILISGLGPHILEEIRSVIAGNR